MQENSETNPENAPGPQESETEPPLPPSTEPEPPKQPEPKRRGRPEGAKDRAPRKKKAVVVEEDIPQNTPEPEAAAPVQTPAPQVQTPPVQTEPDSPRTLIRDAAEHILKLKNVTKMARKAHLQETYTKRLHSLS
jgi:hypothetical protein